MYVIYGSFIPSNEITQKIRDSNIRIALFHPFNSFDGEHNSMFSGEKNGGVPLFESHIHTYADEIILLESHSITTKEYLKTLNLNKIPIKCVPITWNPLFLYKNVTACKMYTRRDSKKLDIVIMEPNSTYCKSSWMPLVISEAFYKKFPDILQRVYLFTKSKNEAMVKLLQISKDNKLRKLDRMPITDIVDFFANPNNNDGAHVIFVSHSTNVPENYAYCDALFSGFSLVHNSIVLKEKNAGLYYDTIDVALQNIRGILNGDTGASPTPYIESLKLDEPKTIVKFQSILPENRPLVQIVIISCNAERKVYMENQLKELNITLPVDFFQGFNPANSKDYIVDYDPVYKEHDTLICCTRSYGAVFNKYKDAQIDYLCIMEDDISLQSNFIEKLYDVIGTPHLGDYVSLGYLLSFKEKDIDVLPKSGTLYSELHKNSVTVWGTQCGLYPKKTMNKLAKLLHADTTKEVRDNIRNLTKKYANRYPIFSPDALIPLSVQQTIVYPPLALENHRLSSEIYGIQNSERMKNLNDYKHINRDIYYKFITNVQIAVISCNEKRKDYMLKQFDETGIPSSQVDFFSAYVPNNSINYIKERHPTYPESDGRICCLRSKGALFEKYKEGEYDYLIVMEDDIALHKDFLSEVDRLVKTMDTSNYNYISMGYLPSFRPNELNDLQCKDNVYFDLYKNNIKVWGNQMTLIPKHIVKRFADHLYAENSTEVRTKINNSTRYANMVRVLQSDALMPLLARQAMVYPPLAIECPNFMSAINSANNNSNFFSVHSGLDPKLYYGCSKK